MPFRPGKSGNPEGRPKGQANKVSSELKEAIANFLQENFDQIQKDFEVLKPRERVRLYKDLLAFVVPKPTEQVDIGFIDLPPTPIYLHPDSDKLYDEQR